MEVPKLDSESEVTVVGAGVTGRAVAETLSRRVKSLFVTDSRELDAEDREFFGRIGADFEEGGHTERGLEADLLVVSPGVPSTTEIVRKARSGGIPVVGEIELADRLSPSERTLAVTGTNGKTTTVELAAALLKDAGKRAVACGNIGKPYIAVAPSLEPSDVPVVEVSSYQLEYASRFKPEVAVLLNLEPDHLERHGSFENYKRTKLKIFRDQKGGDYAVLNRRLDLESFPGGAEVVEFGPEEPVGLELPPHQQENLGAATSAVRCVLEGESPLDVSAKTVEKAVDVPHRLQEVAEIAGSRVVNDSKATNPAAVAAGLESFTEPIRLLLGGRMKEGGYGRLAAELKEGAVSKAYLFGEAREEIAEVLDKRDFGPYKTFTALEEATEAAVRESRAGEVVLLSPGCSSYDEFSSYEERGDEFSEIVKSWS